MAYDPKAVANYFLDLAEGDARLLTPLQVIKLVFCAHGWHLGLTKTPLSYEPPQAWKYGPVFPSVYAAFRQHGDEGIDGRAMSYMDYEVAPVPPPSSAEDGETCKLLDQVYVGYGKFSGPKLSSLTHMKGSPWFKAWYELGGKDKKNFVIPQPLIIEYYQGLSEKNARAREN